MVAQWKWLNPDFCCSECHMKSSILTSRCPFCDSFMTNEEEMWIELMKEKTLIDITRIREEHD